MEFMNNFLPNINSFDSNYEKVDQDKKLNK